MIRRIPGSGSKGAGSAILARAGSILASFVLTVVVARLLDPESAGSFFLWFTTLAVIATFGRFGTDNLALKIAARRDGGTQHELIFAAVVAAFASIVAIIVVAALLIAFTFELPGVELNWMLIVLSSVIPQVFAVFAGAVLRAYGRLAIGTIAELGSIPTLTTVGIVALQLCGVLDIVTALLVLTVASWVSGAWAVLAMTATVPSGAEAPIAAPVVSLGAFIRHHGRALVAMMGTSLLFYVLTWAPVYVLSIAGSLSEVTYYTAALRLANLMTLVPAIQVSYLAPAFARLFHRQEVTDLNALTQRAVRQAAGVLMLPAIVLTIGAGWIVTVVYGAGLDEAVGPLVILALGTYAVVLFGHVNQLMLLCDLESRALILNGVLVVLWATVGLWVADRAGSLGVAVFSAAVGIVYSAGAAVVLRRSRGIRSYLGGGTVANMKDPTP